MRLVATAKALRQQVQGGIMAALSLNFGDSGQNVIPVCPGSAMTLAYQMHLALDIESPGILRMAAIDQRRQRQDPRARRGVRRERDRRMVSR